MATLSISLANYQAILARTVPQQVDQTVTRSSLMYALTGPGEAVIAGANGPLGDTYGARIRCEITRNTGVSAASIGADLPTPGGPTQVEATLDWSPYFATIRVPHAYMLMEGANGSNLYVQQHAIDGLISEGITDLVNAMDSDLKDGDGSTNSEFLGIDNLLVATGTRYGLSVDTYTTLQTTVSATGGNSAPTVAVLDAAVNSFLAAHPDSMWPGDWIGLTSYTTWEDLTQITTGAASRELQIRPYEVVPNVLSVDAVVYRNVPILPVPGYTLGKIDFVRRSALSRRYLGGTVSPAFLGQPGMMPPGADMGQMVPNMGGGTSTVAENIPTSPFHMLPIQWSGQNALLIIATYQALVLRNPGKNSLSITSFVQS